MSAEKLAALNAVDDALHRLEFWGNDEPRCPHCGGSFSVSNHEWWELYEEGEHEVTCPDCDWDFAVYTRVSYSFDTSSQEQGEDTQP